MTNTQFNTTVHRVGDTVHDMRGTRVFGDSVCLPVAL